MNIWGFKIFKICKRSHILVKIEPIHILNEQILTTKLKFHLANVFSYFCIYVILSIVRYSFLTSAEFNSFSNSVSRPSALKTLNSAVANGALSAWQISARVLTDVKPGSSSNCCKGLYSSAGITRSCKYLINEIY